MVVAKAPYFGLRGGHLFGGGCLFKKIITEYDRHFTRDIFYFFVNDCILKRNDMVVVL